MFENAYDGILQKLDQIEKKTDRERPGFVTSSELKPETS
jgi:hypothetical protein